MKSTTAILALAFSCCWMSNAQSQDIEWETLNDEVVSLYKQDRFDRAVVVAKKSLEIAEKSFGPNHPDVATNLENLARLFRATDRKEEAKKLDKRVAKIRACKR